MARAGKSLLRSSGLRAAADDLGRGQKLRATAIRPCSGARFSFAARCLRRDGQRRTEARLCLFRERAGATKPPDKSNVVPLTAGQARRYTALLNRRHGPKVFALARPA